MSQGGVTQIFLYDRFLGDVKFLATDGSGGISQLATHDGWKKSWDIITPGNFGPSASAGLLLYRRDAGEAKFLATTAGGDTILLKQHTDWNTVWDIVVPGNFGGGSHTDFLLYERDTGLAKFHTTNGSGKSVAETARLGGRLGPDCPWPFRQRLWVHRSAVLQASRWSGQVLHDRRRRQYHVA